MAGKRKKKLLFVLLALVFSLGSISVDYAYWTDRLDMEGDAEVRFSVNIIDDVIDRPVSPAALQLIEVPINNNEGSDGNISPDSLTPQPEIVEPEIEKPEIVEPEPEISEPEPEISEPEPEISEPEPEITEPDIVESETEEPVAEVVQPAEE